MLDLTKLLTFPILFLAMTSCIMQAQVVDITQAAEDMLVLDEVNLPDGNVDFFAMNKGVIPITLYIDFEKLKNMKPSVKMPITVVLPPKGEKQFLFKMERGSMKEEANYGFQYGFSMGDELNASHDENFVYHLPFQQGTNQLMGQGNHGKFSHKGINAVDFNMAEGTKICAARGGIVTSTKADSKKGCKSPGCKNQANYILIYHDDGSFGHYGHLKYQGVMVVEGQRVEAGDVIGLSGNTGWSSGPHLHFEVYTQKGNQVNTIPIKFHTGNGKAEYLVEGKFYTAH